MKYKLVAIVAGVILASALSLLHITSSDTEYEHTSVSVTISPEPSRQPTVIPTVTPEDRKRIHPIPSVTHSLNPTGSNNGGQSEIIGRASFYTNEYCVKYNPSCRTASGEVFDDTQFTAACASRYPLGSTLLVKHGDASIQVRCNDRGSFEGSYNRILDLSKASFEALAPTSKGVITVSVQVLN